MTYNLIPFLAQYPCFSKRRLRDYIRKSFRRQNPETVLASVLKRQKSKGGGEFSEVCPSLYVTKAAATAPDADKWLPYILAMEASEDSVIAHQAALLLHLGLGAPERVRYYTRDQEGQRNWEWKGTTFEAVKRTRVPGPEPRDGVPARCHLPIEFAGRVFQVRVTSPEQTLVDVLDMRWWCKRSGKTEDSLDEFQNEDESEDSDDAVENTEDPSASLDPLFLQCWEKLATWKTKLTLRTLKDYLLAVDAKVTTSRVGYFLEGHFSNLGLASVYLHRLKPKLERPQPWAKGATGKLSYRWMLRIPDNLRWTTRAEDAAHDRSRLCEGKSLEDLNLPEQLRRHFGAYGFAKFRPGQEELVAKVLARHDAMGVIPTGAGKSLCFQFPAKLLNGVTLVIIPLLALINEQTAKAQRMGLSAMAHRSIRDTEARHKLLEAIEERNLDLLFTSPEAILPLVNALGELKHEIVQIVVDEAHTMLSWGKDFRPGMRHLRLLRDIWPNVPILALTATAGPEERNAIMKELRYHEDAQLYVGQSFRPGLYLQVQETFGGDEGKLRTLVEFIADHDEHRGKKVCGIVYCKTKEEAERLACALYTKFGGGRRSTVRRRWQLKCHCRPKLRERSAWCLPGNSPGKLLGKSKKARGSSFRLPSLSRAQCYHAGLCKGSKLQAERAFQSRKSVIIVATIAFGLGMDRGDVRFVVNFSPPSSVSDYAQQIGRAGRDGHDAECLLLYDRQDWKMWDIWLDADEERLKKQADHFSPWLVREKNKRLAMRREELQEVRNLITLTNLKGCLHQKLAVHFGETLEPCRSSCCLCEPPKDHRKGWWDENAEMEARLKSGAFEPVPASELLEDDQSMAPREQLDLDPPSE